MGERAKYINGNNRQTNDEAFTCTCCYARSTENDDVGACSSRSATSGGKGEIEAGAYEQREITFNGTKRPPDESPRFLAELLRL